MFRRDLIDILKGRRMSLHELALLLDEKPQDLEDDLQHLARPAPSKPPRFWPRPCCPRDSHRHTPVSPRTTLSRSSPRRSLSGPSTP
jgi:hypothetical protein